MDSGVDGRLVPELIGLGVLLLVSALLSGAEAAYFSLGRTRLKELAEQQGRTPGPLAPLLAQPHELLVTLLVGITVVNIGASALAAAIEEASVRCLDRGAGKPRRAPRARSGFPATREGSGQASRPNESGCVGSPVNQVTIALVTVNAPAPASEPLTTTFTVGGSSHTRFVTVNR